MAKVFISYVAADRPFVELLTTKLIEVGHEVFVDFLLLEVGQDWRVDLNDALRKADAVAVVLSKDSASSRYVLYEMGAASALSSNDDGPAVLPIAIDHVSIPTSIQDIHVLFAIDRDVAKISSAITTAIGARKAKRAIQEQKAQEAAAKIELNSAQYVETAIKTQRKSRFWNGFWGKIWYVAGFGSLLAGIWFVLASLTARPVDTNWLDLATIIVTNVIVIGFLGACARYAFGLGKAYTSEALKSADRIHAISFGQFYLKAFGEKTSWNELKEVFQHWNIDRTSTFSGLDVSQIDPQIISMISQIASTIGAKNKDKDSK